MVGQRCSIEQLLYIELSRVILRDFAYLVVGLTNDICGENQTAATESGKNLVFNSTVNRAEVFDLCLALFRIAVHRKHAQYEFFILHVAVFHSSLETCPVFCSNIGLNAFFHFVLTQVVLEEVSSCFLTILSEFLVECLSTIRRSIAGNLNLVNLFTLCFLGILDSSLQGLYLITLRLRRTNICLLDKELDVCLSEFLDNTLELIRRCCRCVFTHLCQFRRCNHTVCNFYIRNVNHFLSDTSIKTKIEFRLFHLRHISHFEVLRISTSVLVAHGLTIFFCLLTHIGNGFTKCLLTVVLQYRSNNEYTFSSEFLNRESTRDVCSYFTAFEFQCTGIYGNLLRFVQFAARCQHHYRSDEAK